MALFGNKSEKPKAASEEEKFDNETGATGGGLAKKVDKIFNNTYNTGEIEFEVFDLPKVDAFYVEDNMQDVYDSQEYYRQKVLTETIDRYFRDTEYGEQMIAKKKIPKMMLSKIFVSIREQFNGQESSDAYTGVEIFIGIGEYFNLNYEVLYENIPAVFREELVRELDNKYDILKKRGVKKLF